MPNFTPDAATLTLHALNWLKKVQRITKTFEHVPFLFFFKIGKSGGRITGQVRGMANVRDPKARDMADSIILNGFISYAFRRTS